ncbi:MAG: FAD assembly factor SdhE [Paracoccaceae bacterium]
MIETAEARLKRIKMRSWRRGMKEMDLILGPFSDTELLHLSEAQLLIYDQMLSENDQEIYTWFTGLNAAPEQYAALVDIIAAARK